MAFSDDDLSFDEIVANDALDELLDTLALARRRAKVMPDVRSIIKNLDRLFGEPPEEGALRVMLAMCLDRLVNGVDPEVK